LLANTLLLLLSSEATLAACDPASPDNANAPCASVTTSSADTISWEQLSGKKIVLALNMVRRVKVQEDGGVHTDHHDWHFQLFLGPDGALKYTRSDSGYWSDWPGHSNRGGDPARTVSTALGKVHPNPDGRGTAVWTFENGQLIRLSVETAGTKGRTFVIAFNDDAKKCLFQVKEVGQVGGGAKSWLNRKGKKRWLVSIVSQTTSCRIS
jgi:hypothetical protein